ncbi:MAG: putative membrane protein, partial [Cyclobacteriaceae bacterium]
MNQTLSTATSRITSIDLLRGLVMILMALDHVRDYFHDDGFLFDPTDIDQTYPTLFFTRFITHYCAPVFVFLAGTSAFFVGQRKGKGDLSIWLIKRGVWLVILEITVVRFAWFFQLNFKEVDLMVIWVLGLCMIALAGLIHIPKKIIILICLIVIFGHNLTDGLQFSNTLMNNLWIFLHVFDTIAITNHNVIFIDYPLIPWVFVMPLGYYLGELYLPDFAPPKRQKALKLIGFSLVLLFIVIRLLNFYGDSYKWSEQESLIFTIMSFLNVSKYPPSLLYLLITLGPAILFLAYTEKWKGAIAQRIIILGRVAMFYYLIHLYIIHLSALLAAYLTGFDPSLLLLDK